MKILHIGLMVNPLLDVGLSNAFRRVSSEYMELPLSKSIFNDLNTLDFKPDIIFIQVQNDKIHGRPTTDLNPILKKFTGSFIINWTGDIRDYIPSWMNSFDAHLTCFSNWRDVNSFNGKSDFLQIGIDPKNFNRFHEVQNLKATLPTKQIPKIVFMGNNAGHFPLSKYRMQMVKHLKQKYGDRFHIYGNGYPNATASINATPDDPYKMQSLESYIYSKSKIAISLSHYDVDGYYSDRLLRCMASGPMVLSHNYKGIEREWKVGKDLDAFNNTQDLESKINHYLLNDFERQTIADRGYMKVHTAYTYTNMAKNIVKLYKKHHG